MGKAGYFNQNPAKMYASAMTTMGNNNKNKFIQNNSFLDYEYPNDMNNNNLLNIKRKNLSGIEEFESIFLKKIKSDNRINIFSISTIKIKNFKLEWKIGKIVFLHLILYG